MIVDDNDDGTYSLSNTSEIIKKEVDDDKKEVKEVKK